MEYFDVFNGDADGICALHQYRLSQPAQSTLITGVKRDIALLGKVSAGAGDVISVFDISLDKNRDAVLRHLQANVEVHYFDHHYAGDIPSNPNFNAHIDTSAETCTSVIVDSFLNGKFRPWAIVGAFGDGFDDLARKLAETVQISDLDKMRTLGNLINYNAYGSSLDDLHIAPADLYRAISKYKLPEEFLQDESYRILQEGYAEDNACIDGLQPEFETEKQAVYMLPNEKWARRISGVFANELNKKYPNRAHALLTDIGDNNFLVSIRAPATTKTGADELCRQFETGGGRKAAAGINRLPASDYDIFLKKFVEQFS